MIRLAMVLFAVSAAFAAEDPWSAVRGITSGAEVRAVQRGAAQPVRANMDELRGGSLIVVIKSAQVAIPRDRIERIDLRPRQTGSRAARESKTTSTTGRVGEPSSSALPGIFFGSQPDLKLSTGEPPARRNSARIEEVP
jgi:hypothetical protein